MNNLIENYDKLPLEKQKELVKLAIFRKIRKKENMINYYNAGKKHQKQIDFHNVLAKVRLFLGGNRSGKTVAGAAESVYHATLQYPDWWEGRKFLKATNGWVVSLDSYVQIDVAQKEISRWLPRDAIDVIIDNHRSKVTYEDFVKGYKVVQTIHLKNGSSIGFKNCEAGRGKFQGTSKDWIWLDEEPPKDVYDECKARTVDSAGILYLTMTPLKGFTWVYKEIYQKPIKGVNASFTVDMRENPYLLKKEIDIFESTLDEKRRE